jgi:cell division protein FtsW
MDRQGPSLPERPIRRTLHAPVMPPAMAGAAPMPVSGPPRRNPDSLELDQELERFGSVSPRPRLRPPAPADKILANITFALVAIGLFSVFTASAVQADLETGSSLSILIKQVISAIVGTVVLTMTSRIPFERWKKLARLTGVVSILLLVMTMFIGNTANGSERWIILPFGFTFQPSDVAKVAAIFLMAQATSQKRLMTGNMILNFLLVAGMILLILKQPNLSVSIILVMLALTMLMVAGLPLGILGILSVGGVVGAVREITHNPYQMERISGWLSPWKDAQDTGYNLIQSYYAIGSGGLFGVGLGNSIQKLYYLPFQHTDFIFAVICEEWGFIGATMVLGLFGVLAWRGFAIAWNCPNRFGQMLAFGLTMAITLQAAINVCVTVGLMPVTGVTLPLISYGGTSMIVTLAMIGILLNISRHRGFEPDARVATESF